MINMSDRNQVITKLKELQHNNLPKVDIEEFKKVSSLFSENINNATEKEKVEINQYLSKFYIDSNGHCIFTEECPDLEWGLTHGVMHDRKTGLSWRAYHYLTINGKETRFEVIMQYHPDCYGICDED